MIRDNCYIYIYIYIYIQSFLCHCNFDPSLLRIIQQLFEQQCICMYYSSCTWYTCTTIMQQATEATSENCWIFLGLKTNYPTNKQNKQSCSPKNATISQHRQISSKNANIQAFDGKVTGLPSPSKQRTAHHTTGAGLYIN